jgi:phosphate:Na+ symporter
MESVVVMTNLFGAVALLLFGLAQVRDGAIRALGARLRSGLASSTRGSFRSFISGSLPLLRSRAPPRPR